MRTDSGWLAGFYYVGNCLNALATLPDEAIPQVTAVIPSGFNHQLLLTDSSAPSWLHIVELNPTLSNAEELSRLYQQLGIDVVFPITSVPPVQTVAATIGWIPDFQHVHYPEFFTDAELYVRKHHYAFLAGYCDRLVCSSSQVLQDFALAFPGVQDKGELLPFAVTLPTQALTLSPTSTLERYGLAGRPYAYLPNQFWAHKNHRTAYEAWRIVIDSDPAALLVCSGMPHDYRAPQYYQELEEFVHNHNLDGNILRLGELDRTEQLQIMRGAACVIQPSLFEGWSTSVEEAKALGKPLIVSDLIVHRDQCSQVDARYFPARDPEALARLALERLRDAVPRNHDQTREDAARREYQVQVRTFAERLLGCIEQARAEHLAHAGCASSRQLMLQWTASLTDQIASIENDRAARLEDVDVLTSQLATTETDRAARLEAIRSLTQRLTEVEADRAARLDAINTLTEQLATCEADRAARLDTINALSNQVSELEADRAARLEQINALTALLTEVEADRAARLDQINTLTNDLQDVQDRYRAALEATDELSARPTTATAGADKLVDRQSTHA